MSDLNRAGALPATLPRKWYTDGAIYNEECEKIFRSHWWLLGRLDQLAEPGSCVASRAAKWPVIVSRGADGELHGFHNVCRHRAGPLLNEGECRKNAQGLVCKYHGWRYALDGRLLHPVGLSKTDINFADFSLFPVRVDSWNGMVFACLNDSAPGLHEWLGDVIEIAKDFPGVKDMSYQGDVVKLSAINWKTYGDNSCEGYHVGMVHRALGEAIPRDQIDIRGYENGEFVGFDVQYQPTETDPTRRGRSFWVYKFPTTLMHFSETSFNAEAVTPLAHNQLRIQRWFWVAEEEARRQGVPVDDLVSSAEQVMGEDLGICEHVQQNLAVGVYQAGVLSPQHEPGAVFFQQLIRSALGGAR